VKKKKKQPGRKEIFCKHNAILCSVEVRSKLKEAGALTSLKIMMHFLGEGAGQPTCDLICSSRQKVPEG